MELKAEAQKACRMYFEPVGWAVKWLRGIVEWIAARVNDWATSIELQQLRRRDAEREREHAEIVRAKDVEMSFSRREIDHWKAEVSLLEARHAREFARIKSERDQFVEKSIPK